ncbi:helix-turn-helix transcriptional regulator [Sphingopyxis sp. P8]|uniref:helix-turn-helix domain-containing protein n=1 Tax=Sphingopyxis sp. P8 TaxID=2763256 RepID=UPI001D0B26D3
MKDWRQKRGLTQSQVVRKLIEVGDPKLPQTAASLSRLENGKQPYSRRILEALATVYRCTPDQLICSEPSTVSAQGAPLNYLREWREHSGLTQEQLATLVGTSPNMIGYLESGKRSLTHQWLVRLSRHLGTTAGAILDSPPRDVTALMQMWSQIPRESREQALRTLRSFVPIP